MGEEITDLQKIDAILEWAQSNDTFDITFVESLYDRLENGYELTDKQKLAVLNIIEKFEIPIEEYV